MFNPQRLSLARRRRALTQKTLAQAVGISPPTQLRYEHGVATPPEEVVQKYSQVLSFPIGFFGGEDLDEPEPSSASFRSMSTMTARERDAALAAGAIGFMLSDWVEQRFSMPEPDLLDLNGETPEGAARSLREKWGLGERPVKNLVRLLESKGIRVFSLAENTKSVDAFSLWRRAKPYMFLNTFKTPERTRFDAVHELAHLVMHRHGGASGRRDIEEEAHRFAASFLMPTGDVLATVTHVRYLNQMLQYKQRWRVSVAALNHQLFKLKILSEWQYRTNCIEIVKQGYREREPFGIERERSVAWQKVFDTLRQEKVNKADVAEALCIPNSEIENLIFQLVNMMSVDGDGTNPGRSRASLRLIA